MKNPHLRNSKRIGFLTTTGAHALLAVFLILGPAVAEVQLVTMADIPLGVYLTAVETCSVDAAPRSDPAHPQNEGKTESVCEEPSPEMPAINSIKQKKAKPVSRKFSDNVPKTVPPSTDQTLQQAEAERIKSKAEEQAKQAKKNILSLLASQIEKYKRYPQSARRLNLEGIVIINVVVSQSGVLQSVRVEANGAHDILYKAAQETMRKVQASWKNQPLPEDVQLVIPLQFTLTDKS